VLFASIGGELLEVDTLLMGFEELVPEEFVTLERVEFTAGVTFVLL
jgi:hypothetical protein